MMTQPERSDFNCVGCGRDGYIACPSCPYEVIAAALGWTAGYPEQHTGERLSDAELAAQTERDRQATYQPDYTAEPAEAGTVDEQQHGLDQAEDRYLRQFGWVE